jgi:hypothetical protein
MSNSTEEPQGGPLSDDEMTTGAAPQASSGLSDADGTGGDSYGTDGDSSDSSDGDADGSDGDSSDSSDGDADGTDGSAL